MLIFGYIVAALVLAVILILVVGQPLLKWLRRKEAEQGIARFKIQREQLELKFFELASKLGKPKDVRWLDCQWHDTVAFARDLETGLLTAFVAVNIRFEAIEGGDMEEVEAVGLLRDAAAVFHYNAGNWGTGGRALFNMNPTDAVQRLNGQFESVEAG